MSESDLMARVVEIPHDVPPDLDIEIWSDVQDENRGVEILPGFLHQGLRSHILLAACGAGEVAYEDKGSGVFTSSLLKTLSAVGVQNITYTNLFQRLPSLPTGRNP